MENGYWKGFTRILHILRGIVQKSGLSENFTESNSAIQVCKIRGNEKVKYYSKRLAEKGFEVRPILSPTVPKGEERLRFCIHAFNTNEEMENALGIVKKLVINEE